MQLLYRYPDCKRLILPRRDWRLDRGPRRLGRTGMGRWSSFAITFPRRALCAQPGLLLTPFQALSGNTDFYGRPFLVYPILPFSVHPLALCLYSAPRCTPLAMATPLPRKRGIVSVSSIEKSLGFWWPRGISREKGRTKHDVINSLLKEVNHITHEYACYLPPHAIETSEGIKAAAASIFRSHGPRLWPDCQTQAPWLAIAAHNNLEGHYPADLRFTDPADHDL